jgi:hypothetical protein
MKKGKELYKEADKKLILIFEMIDASAELARKRGKHPLEDECNCIACVNKRKSLLFKNDKEWKHLL